MTAATAHQGLPARRGVRGWARTLIRGRWSPTATWPATKLLATRPNFPLVCLLLYIFIVHSGRLPIAQPVLAAGLLVSFTLRGGIRFPPPVLWFGALVLWAFIIAPLSPFKTFAFAGTYDLLKVWLIALLGANAIRTRSELRLFILFWVGMFGLFPVRGTTMNYLAGIGEFGRYHWNFTFHNPNDLASFCLLQIAMCVALLQVERVKWLRICALLGVLALTFITLITQSRGGMLALASFGALAIFWQRHRIRTLVFASLAVVVLLAAAPEKVLGRLGGLAALAGGTARVTEVDPEQSAASRYSIWRVAMSIWRAYPITGAGWGAYDEMHRIYALRLPQMVGFARGARDAHGTYVKLLAESGVVGLALFMGIVFSSRAEMKRVAKRIKDTQPEMSRFLRMLMIGQVAYLQAAIFGSYEHLPFFYLYTMMAVCAARMYDTVEPSAVPEAIEQPRFQRLLGRRGWWRDRPGSGPLMCGIAGFAGFPERDDEARALVGRMCDAIRHRGPDGEGVGVYDHVALGMRRLSIIDVHGGWQPIANEDESVQIVFNGEIYNHRAFRRSLEQAGHHFRTRSDTETIVHGYEEHGERVVDHLRGMFGFALWDRRRERLVLGRDRFGQKPLYIWEHDGGIAFASELKSLLQLPRFRPRLDREALLRYLALGYVPDPMSIYAGVRKLRPGHVLVWERGVGSRETRYWSPIQPRLEAIEEGEAIEEIRRRLADAVTCHLESDVPLGAFLSGGVDSAAVVAQMSRVASGRVKTFTIGFDDPRFNEAPNARKVAEALGTEHTELVVRPDSELLIDTLALQFDEPFADSSALPTYLVSKLAREHVTVALSGDGGDELFGGYRRYQRVRQPRVRNTALRGAMSGLARALPHGAYGRNYLLNLTRTERGRYASTVAFPLAVEEGGVVRRDRVPASMELERLLASQFDECRDADFFAQMGLVDVLSYLPGDILTKVDRMSMAVSLEARVPLLDHEFAEFALSLPSALKVRDGRGKYIFRKALAGLVPDSVFHLPKSGFSVPLGAWFRGPLRHRVEALRDPSALVREYVDGEAVERHLAEHLAERRDHSHALWRLLVLDVWLRHHDALALA